MSMIVNPIPFLADLTGKRVRVRLKWGQEYEGELASSDAYMNLQLNKTEEFVDGEFSGMLGEVLIRCNNVLYIKAAEMKESIEKGPENNAMDEQWNGHLKSSDNEGCSVRLNQHRYHHLELISTKQDNSVKLFHTVHFVCMKWR